MISPQKKIIFYIRIPQVHRPQGKIHQCFLVLQIWNFVVFWNVCLWAHLWASVKKVTSHGLMRSILCCYCHEIIWVSLSRLRWYGILGKGILHLQKCQSLRSSALQSFHFFFFASLLLALFACDLCFTISTSICILLYRQFSLLIALSLMTISYGGRLVCSMVLYPAIKEMAKETDEEHSM